MDRESELAVSLDCTLCSCSWRKNAKQDSRYGPPDRRHVRDGSRPPVQGRRRSRDGNDAPPPRGSEARTSESLPRAAESARWTEVRKRSKRKRSKGLLGGLPMAVQTAVHKLGNAPPLLDAASQRSSTSKGGGRIPLSLTTKLPPTKFQNKLPLQKLFFLYKLPCIT